MQFSATTKDASMWRYISDIGLLNTTDETTRKKVMFINQLSFMMLVCITLSTLIFLSAHGSTPTTWVVASLNFIPLVTILLNRYSLINLSRLFFGVATPIMVLSIIVILKILGSYHGYNFKVSELHFYTPRYYMVALSLLPVFLIDLHERKMFAASLIINVSCLAMFDVAHDMFGVGHQHYGFVFTNYYQASVMPVVLLMFLYGSIIFYKYEGKKYEEKILGLNHELKLHNDQITTELNLAKTVVEHLIPTHLPQVDGLTISAYLQWSRQVGGDYYTVKRIDDNRTLFIVADVSGKGLEAAIIVSTFHSYVETQLNTGQFTLTDFIQRMNTVLCKITEESKYVTCWVGVYDHLTNNLESVTAGHPAPLLHNNITGITEELRIGGTVLGFFDEGYKFKTETRTLQKGDTLLIYTDGVSEAVNLAGVQYEDSDRLPTLLKRNAQAEPQYIIRTLNNDIRQFTGTDQMEDDLTCMVIRKN